MPPKPRPPEIYREESLNADNEWICNRMTHDYKRFTQWRKDYMDMASHHPVWLREHRFSIGTVEWREDI